ncbi:MAG: dTDP-4-dehydrorhamnose reductase [Telluria sp.]
MKILLLGATGQVGYELRRSLQGLGDIVAPGRSALDLANLGQVRDSVRAIRPGLIVNAAAYTAVERAETDAAMAFRINAEAPAVLAEAARDIGAAMVHYSTDYVFDGAKGTPYVEEDPPSPLNVYGRSKLAGEQAVAAAGIAHLILRTSWVYGLRGNNFLLTMLKLARERGAVSVVDDQFGTPTWSRTVAQCTAHILAQGGAGGSGWWDEHGGLYHLSCEGQTSWHGFAQAIMDAADVKCEVQAISTGAYSSRVQRPRNSALCCDKFAAHFFKLPNWREALQMCLS